MQRYQTPDLAGELDSVYSNLAYRAPVAPMLNLYSESSAMDVDTQQEGTTRVTDSFALTAPPNSPLQPLDIAKMSPPTSTEPQHTATMHGLFGPHGPAFPVRGTEAALRTLAEAISDGLAVVEALHDGDLIVEGALYPLRARGVVPDHREEGILELENYAERQALGLKDDQFSLTPEESKVLESSYAPFLSQLEGDSNHFDVAKVLVMLRIFARYWQRTGKKYQMLVVTNLEGPQPLDAQIFSTQEDAGETIFLYRKLKFRGFFGGAPTYEESWLPISFGPDAIIPARELDLLGRTPQQAKDQEAMQPTTPAIQQRPRIKKPKTTLKAQVTPAVADSGTRERAKPIHSGIDITAYQGMTPDQVFATVKQELADETLHPNGVAGERLLLFAVRYSNVEIRDLLLPFCELYNQTLPTPNNVYNGRILPAIKASMDLDQTFEKAKAEFDNQRKANDLKTTSGMRGKSTQEVKISSTPRKRKRAVQIEEPEEDEAEMSNEDMTDDEDRSIPTPRQTRTRGARPLASYKVIADEDDEDEEMEGVNEDRAKARYKRAKMDDNSDDEDGEFELDA